MIGGHKNNGHLMEDVHALGWRCEQDTTHSSDPAYVSMSTGLGE
jgi:hypothetical protein